MFIYGLYAINTADSNKVDDLQPKFRPRPKSYSICGQNQVIDSFKNLISSKSLNCLVKAAKINDEVLNEQEEEEEVNSDITTSQIYQKNLLIFEKNLEKLAKKTEQEKLENFLFNSCESNPATRSKMFNLIQNRRHTTFSANEIFSSKQSSNLVTVNEERPELEKSCVASNKNSQRIPRKISISDLGKRLFKNLTFNGKEKNTHSRKNSTRKSSRTSYNELIDRYNMVRKKNSSLNDIFSKNEITQGRTSKLPFFAK